MFAKSIVLSDAFLDMPLSARCLYFTLGMLSDDDGFIGNPKAIMRQCGASQDDMAVLLQKRYVLGFESGVIVIKHWRMNNYLRNDRYHTTTYLEEKERLRIDERGAYTEKDEYKGVCEVGIPQIEKRYTEYGDTEVRLGKDSIGNNNILSDKSDDAQQIIDYLNSKLGTHYTTKGKANTRLINGRLQEGHTVADFKTVIDNKYKEWGKDPKMAKYLRPETLFNASHFESYLNEVRAEPQIGTRKYDYKKLEEEFVNG